MNTETEQHRSPYTPLEREILRRAKRYETASINLSGKDSILINAHFKEKLEPILKNRKEHLVELWPSGLFWDIEERTSPPNGLFTDLYGYGGVGYVCLTDKNAYLVSIGKLTEKHPPIEKKKFNLLSLILPSPVTDNRLIEKEDRVWEVSSAQIIGSKIIRKGEDKLVKLITAATTWEIYCLEPDHLLTAIEMLQKEKLVRALNPQVNIDFEKQSTLLAECAYCKSIYKISNSIKCPHCGASEPHVLSSTEHPEGNL